MPQTALDALIASLLTLYSDYWNARRTVMLERWDYYNGDQAKYFPQFRGETEMEYAERIAHAVVENHCKATVNISAGYLYGDSERIARHCHDPAAQDIVERIWEFNNLHDFVMDVAITAGVTGFCVVYKQWVDPDTGLPYPEMATLDDRRNGVVSYVLFDSVETIPIPRPDNPKILDQILRVSFREEGSGLPLYDRLSRRTYNTYTIVEHWDDVAFHQWTYNNQWIGSSLPNVYSSVRTPFVVFSNPGDPLYLEGDPDHQDVMPLNRDLNERLTDDRNTIIHHSFPILVSAVDIADFVRKPNSYLKGDPNLIKYLTWANVLEGSQHHAEELRRNIPLVSSISDLSRGRSADIGQVRSGAGLRSMFQADILAIKRRRKRAIRFEQWNIRSDLEMTAFHTGQTFSDKTATIQFPDDIIGLDELLKAQAEQLALGNGTISLKDILSRNYPQLSDGELEQKLEEIRQYNEWKSSTSQNNGRTPHTNVQSSYDQELPV